MIAALVWALALSAAMVGDASPEMHRLLAHLLANYNAAVRPVLAEGGVTIVSIGYTLQSLLGVVRCCGRMQLT